MPDKEYSLYGIINSGGVGCGVYGGVPGLMAFVG
jgi:hypothetical protein